MAGRLFAGFFGAGARVDEISRNAFFHQIYTLARDAFAVERRAELQRVIRVVDDGDVLAEELLAQAFGEAGTLVGKRGGCKIVKEKPDEIESGGGLEDYGVFPRS